MFERKISIFEPFPGRIAAWFYVVPCLCGISAVALGMVEGHLSAVFLGAGVTSIAGFIAYLAEERWMQFRATDEHAVSHSRREG